MIPDEIYHLPHCRDRNEEIKYIIIHCSLGNSEKQIQTLDELGLSVHYIIGRNRKITEVLSPKKVAFHAGLSRWQQSAEKSLNNCSIGIEIETLSLGQASIDYPRGVIKKLCDLLSILCQTYHIKPENILAHSDIAPARKPDPGVSFPWKRLVKHGFGVWYNQQRLSLETDEIKLLETIGYDTTNLPAARYAFCRHFFPKEISFISDINTLLNTPYPANFSPKEQKKYLKILRATAHAFTEQRKNA